MERETGFEPATLSLGMPSGESAADVRGWQPSEKHALGDPQPTTVSPGLAAIRTREAPIEPQGIAQDARGAENGRKVRQRTPPRPQRASGDLAWLSVSEVAKELRVSSATVYRLIDRAELKHMRVSNAIRISRADLATFLRGGS
jgi:excisionase family DNA binding protein